MQARPNTTPHGIDPDMDQLVKLHQQRAMAHLGSRRTRPLTPSLCFLSCCRFCCIASRVSSSNGISAAFSLASIPFSSSGV